MCASGSISVKVSHNDQEKQLGLLIVPGSGPGLRLVTTPHLGLDITTCDEHGRWMAGSCGSTYRCIQRGAWIHEGDEDQTSG